MRRSPFLLLALLLASGGSVRAASAGSTGAAFLELTYSPRYAAMGSVGTAWSEDAGGIQINPAGLAVLEVRTVQFSHDERFDDAAGISDNLFTFATPWREGSDAWGLSLIYVDLGTFQRTTISNPTGLGTFEASDLALSATYARRLTRAISVGASAKYIYESLDTFNASAFAIDAGIRYESPIEGLTFGASMLHAGTGLRFVRETSDLPLTFRVGAGYKTPSGRLGVAADLVWVKNQDVEGAIGVEYWIVRDLLALRGGFTSANDLDHGFSFGLGGKVSRINFDYAYTPFEDLGSVHQFGVGYAFGEPVREEPRRVARRAAEGGRESIRALDRAGICVLPFASEVAGFEWAGEVTPRVLEDYLRRWGVPVASSPAAAARWVEGEYRLTSRGVQAVARITDPDRVGAPERITVDGRMEAPFAMWEALAEEIAVRTGAAPAAPGARATSVRPVAPMEPVRFPPPAPPARRPDVEVLPVEGSGSSDANRVADALTRAIERGLADEGIAAGSGAGLEVRVALTVEGDGRMIVWGRVIDTASGYPVRSISTTGFVSRIEEAAEAVVREVALAVR